MSKTGATGLRRIVNATRYSMLGLKAAWIHEAAFRQELMLTVLMTATALLLPDLTPLDRFLLAVFPWLVMTVELLNSAIEAVVDRFGGTKTAFDTLSTGTQRMLLEAEGVGFLPDGKVDLAHYQWRP